MDLVFFGSGAFGIPVLEDLAARHDVRLVVSQPDRPAGRRRRVRGTPVASRAEALGLRVLRTERANADADRIREVSADVWVVIAFGQRLSASLLENRLAINLHASLLPRWRGAAPIHHAVMAGDTQTGVSVITLADRMDAGDVLASQTLEIGPTDTTGELHERLAALGPPIIERVLEAASAGALDRRPQDTAAVTTAPKLDRAAAHIDVSMSPDTARCRINGCSPWPGCDLLIDGDVLRLLRAAPHDGPWTAGALSEDGVLGLQGGGIRLMDVQRQGGRPAAFAAWARGRHHAWPVPFETPS